MAMAGYSKSEVTKVVLERNMGVNDLPSAVAALRSVYGQQELGMSEVLAGASITTPEQALPFMQMHHYTLQQMVVVLKTVFSRTSGEATTLLSNQFLPNRVYTLNEILNKVALGYSSNEESTILDVLAASNVTTPRAAIVTMRQLGYDQVNEQGDLTIITRVLKNGYGQNEAQATELLIQDAVYSTVMISAGITAVYHANEEIGRTAQLLIGARITDSLSAVRYLAEQEAGIDLTARVLHEIYHEEMTAAINYMSYIPRYTNTRILLAVQQASGTDPLFGYLGTLKLQGASAYQIANELEKQGRLESTFMVGTLMKLGYSKESIVYELLNRFSTFASEEELAQHFVTTGFTDAASIAKQLLRTKYNPNEGVRPARILILALPAASHGAIALGMRNAGFTSAAVISGLLTFGFDDTVAVLLKQLGYPAAKASSILEEADYSTEERVIRLKTMGYPLSEYFHTLGGYGKLVPILKRQGFTAIEIAQGMYRSNESWYWILKYLDEGGFSDLPTLVQAYYRSGQPVLWVIRDVYQYGSTNINGVITHRWALKDVVNQLLSNEPINMVTLAGLINYANGNNYNETFGIVKTLSTAEQAALRNQLGVANFLVGDHVPNVVGLTVMKSIGRSAQQAAVTLKSAGGVSDYKDAALILFMAGYGVTDVIDAVFDNYRTEIGIQVLIALFSSGMGQILKDWDKYKFVITRVVNIVSYHVE